MLGISVYLSSFDEDYITKAASLGVKWVFTSLHIPEEKYQPEIVLKLLSLTQKLGLKCMVDISPITFEKLGLMDRDFIGLKQLGFEWVRLDFGFESVSEILEIGKVFNLVLNASTLQKGELETLIKQGLDVKKCVLMHNFYPLSHTALSVEKFTRLCEDIKHLGQSQMVFVPGETMRRLPMYEGLPTLETHRGFNAYVAGLDMFKKFGVDWVFVGDPQTKLIHLKWLMKYQLEKTVTLPAFLSSNEELYDREIDTRFDSGESYLRLKLPRVKDVKIYNNIQPVIGSIIQINVLSERYSGEVGIVTKPLPLQARVNVIGFVHPEYLECLKVVDENVKLRLVRLSEAKYDY